MSAVQKFPPAHMIPDETEEASSHQPANNDQSQTQPQQPLGLPAAPTKEEAEATRLDLSAGANAVKLDHLGPMVVNSDGTLSRIHNWADMTEGERERTVKVLGKRNKLRTAALESAEGGK